MPESAKREAFMTPFLLALLLASSPAVDDAGAPLVLLKQTSLGFSDAEAEAQRQALTKSVGEAGLTLQVRAPGLEASCLEDAACVADALTGKAGGARLELTRIGPLVQVHVVLYRPDGTVLADKTRAWPTEQVLAEGPPLEDDIKSGLATLRAEAPSTSPASSVGESSATDDAPDWRRYVPVAMGLTGIGATALGMIGSAGFASLALNQSLVLEDATSLGTEKETARIIGIGALGGAVLSVGVILTGVAMMGGALVIDPTRHDDAAAPAETAPAIETEGEPDDSIDLDLGVDETQAPGEAAPNKSGPPSDPDDPEPSDAPMGGTELDAQPTDDATVP